LAAQATRPSRASPCTPLLDGTTAESSEKGAKLFFFDLDHDIAGGMSPNKGENQDSKKELHLDDKDSSPPCTLR